MWLVYAWDLTKYAFENVHYDHKNLTSNINWSLEQ